MQNKKRLHRHLLLIYIIYFAALIVGFAASFVPDFSRGWRDAQDTLEIEIPQGGIRSYYVSAPVVRKAAEPVVIEGLPASIEPTISRIDLRVQVDEAYTLGNAFKVMGNNVYCYLLMVITGLSYLTILVLIALIINSLRKSIRDEQPLRHSNILRTRAIGILILVAELSEASDEIHQQHRGGTTARRHLFRGRGDISAELLECDRRYFVPLHGRGAFPRDTTERRAETDYLK